MAALLLVYQRQQQQKQQQNVSKDIGAAAGLVGTGVSLLSGALGSTAATVTGTVASTAALEATADSVAETAITLDTSGYAAANAADAELVADAALSGASVLGAAAAASWMVLCVLAFVALGIALGALDQHADWWDWLVNRKHQRLFQQWWQHEESALIAYLGDANQPGTGYDAKGSRFFDPQPNYLYLEASTVPGIVGDDGADWDMAQFPGTLYLGQIFDVRVSKQRLTDLRICARWFAITQSLFENRATKAFFDSQGQAAPFDSTKSGGYVPASSSAPPGGFGQQVHVNPETTTSGYSGSSFLPGNGTLTALVPSMSEAAFLELANNYCALQPFARTGQIPAAEDLRTLAGMPRLGIRTDAVSSPLTSGDTAAPASPDGPFADSMAVPGFLSQYTTWSATQQRAIALLGSDFSPQANVARVLGHASALAFLAASIVYQNAIWPGDDAVTKQLRDQCGLAGTYSVVHVIIARQPDGSPDGRNFTCLRDKSTGYLIDVIAGRNPRGATTYLDTTAYTVDSTVAA